MIKIVFCDIDGCIGDFTKPEYPLKQEIGKNKKSLELIKNKVDELKNQGIIFGVSTGRSFYQADHIMETTGHQGPSIFEMGNVIFEPSEGVYNLFERHEKFKDCVEVVREFIQWKNQMKNNEQKIKEFFPGSNVRQMKDRSCMLTYEFDKEIGNELYSLIESMFPEIFKNAVEKKLLKVLISKNAIDILPSLTKGDAVSYLINKYGIRKEEVLAIGDSSHSDLDFLDSAGIIACPDNADEKLKNFVLLNNGFVVPNKSSQGLLNILDLVRYFIKFNMLKNESRNLG